MRCLSYDQGGAGERAIGQMTEIANSYSTTYFTNFNYLGQAWASTQEDLGQNYNFSYTYNLAGGLTGETYPSGRTVLTSFDTLNRPNTTAATYPGGSKTYVKQTGYWPTGVVNQQVYGNNVVGLSSYNSRLQTTQLSASLNGNMNQVFWIENYAFGQPTANNGNLTALSEGTGNAQPYNAIPYINESFPMTISTG